MTPCVPLLLAAALVLVPGNAAQARLRGLTGRPVPSGLRAALDATVPALSHFLRSPWVAAVGSGGVLALWFPGSAGALAGASLGAVVWRMVRASAKNERADPLALAAGWDLLAAGMRAGLPVSVAVRAVSEELGGSAARVLREVADHLALGSDPVSAWEPALAHPDTAELARAARRTARTGSGLAATSADLAAQSRAALDERSQARAQRAAVWISAPLGLCFLPAFLCLGVIPVVIGMAQRLTGLP